MSFLAWGALAAALALSAYVLMRVVDLIATRAEARRHTERYTMAHPVGRPGASTGGRRAS